MLPNELTTGDCNTLGSTWWPTPCTVWKTGRGRHGIHGLRWQTANPTAQRIWLRLYSAIMYGSSGRCICPVLHNIWVAGYSRHFNHKTKFTLMADGHCNRSCNMINRLFILMSKILGKTEYNILCRMKTNVHTVKCHEVLKTYCSKKSKFAFQWLKTHANFQHWRFCIPDGSIKQRRRHQPRASSCMWQLRASHRNI